MFTDDKDKAEESDKSDNVHEEFTEIITFWSETDPIFGVIQQ